MHKAVFLDRDGVINHEQSYINKIKDFVFIDGVFESLSYLKKLNYILIIVTNQSGIGRGMYTKNDFLILNNWMLSKFLDKDIIIDDVFYCPHAPEANCNCRKPKPGMFEQCFKKFVISKKDSWMIGDSERDIEAAIMAGITNNILVRSGHPISETTTKASTVIDSIKDITNIIKS